MSCKGGCGQMPNTVALKLEALKITGGNVDNAKDGYKFMVSGIKAADINGAHKGQTPETRKVFLGSPMNSRMVWSQYLMGSYGSNPGVQAVLKVLGLKLRMTATELGEWIRNGA